MNTPSKKNIIIFVVIFVVAFLGYTFFFTGGSSTNPLETQAPLLAQSNVKGKDLLKVLLSLNSIKLDEEIFSSGLFTSLEDFTIILPDAGVSGRKNPFAPIGKDSTAQTQTAPSKITPAKKVGE